MRPHARLRPAPLDPGRGGDAHRGVHRVHAVPVRRRSGDQPARARTPPPSSASNCVPTSGSMHRFRCSSRASWATRVQRRIRTQPAPGPQGVDADRRALSGHARTVAVGRRHRAAGGRAAGRVHGAAARQLRLAGVDDAVAGRRVAADLPDRHPADPGVCGDLQGAAQLRPRRRGQHRRLDHRLADAGRLEAPGAAGDHAVGVSAGADHAAGARRDARGAAHRLHQVRARPRAAAIARCTSAMP